MLFFFSSWLNTCILFCILHIIYLKPQTTFYAYLAHAANSSTFSSHLSQSKAQITTKLGEAPHATLPFSTSSASWEAALNGLSFGAAMPLGLECGGAYFGGEGRAAVVRHWNHWEGEVGGLTSLTPLGLGCLYQSPGFWQVALSIQFPLWKSGLLPPLVLAPPCCRHPEVNLKTMTTSLQWVPFLIAPQTSQWSMPFFF